MVKAHLLETRIPVQLSSVMYYQKSLVEKSIAPVLIYELSMHVHWVPSPKDGHHLIGNNSPWLTWTSYSFSLLVYPVYELGTTDSFLTKQRSMYNLGLLNSNLEQCYESSKCSVKLHPPVTKHTLDHNVEAELEAKWKPSKWEPSWSEAEPRDWCRTHDQGQKLNSLVLHMFSALLFNVSVFSVQYAVPWWRLEHSSNFWWMFAEIQVDILLEPSLSSIHRTSRDHTAAPDHPTPFIKVMRSQ